MIADPKWRKLGWRHPLWDLVRFYLSLRHKSEQARWLERLEKESSLSVDDGASFKIAPEDVRLFFEYLPSREQAFSQAFSLLRLEEEALAYCEGQSIAVKTTSTRSRDHHQSSKAMVAIVSAIAESVCKKLGIAINSNPQRRCVWCNEKGLHVSARNIDGAVPSLANPMIIWEIKEYWGVTSGGSKMSDAVYECNLVGRELREYEERTGLNVVHIVFVDGKIQWTARRSDLNRFVDLLNQGLIDHLIVGKEVESDWESTLTGLLSQGG